MVPDNKNNVDPTVQAIVEMFPEDFLRNTARETGVVERERKNITQDTGHHIQLHAGFFIDTSIPK